MKLYWAIYFLFISLGESADARYCYEVFKQGRVQRSIDEVFDINAKNIRTSRDLNPILLLPHRIPKDNNLTKSELENSTAESLGIHEGQRAQILEAMRDNEHVIFSEFGVSLMAESVFRSWQTLGESQILKNEHAAQDAIEAIAKDPSATIPGVREFWIEQLRNSSERGSQARARSLQEVGERPFDFPRSVITHVTSLHRATKEEHQIASSKANAFEFPWGANTKSGKYDEMNPKIAQEIARILSNLTLIENTLYFSNGGVFRIHEDNVISIDTQLFLAVNPHLFPLIDVFKMHPVDFNGNNIYKIGGFNGPVDFVNFRFSKKEESIVFMSGVANGKIELQFKLGEGKEWYSHNLWLDITTTLSNAIYDILIVSRPFPTQDISQTFNYNIQGEYLTVSLNNLTLLESAYVIHKLRHLLVEQGKDAADLW